MALSKTEAGVWTEIEKLFFNAAVCKEDGFVWTTVGVKNFESCGLDAAPVAGSNVPEAQVASWSDGGFDVDRFIANKWLEHGRIWDKDFVKFITLQNLALVSAGVDEPRPRLTAKTKKFNPATRSAFFSELSAEDKTVLQEQGGKLQVLKNFLETVDKEVRAVIAGNVSSGSKLGYIMCRARGRRQVVYKSDSVNFMCRPECGHRMEPVETLLAPGTTVRYLPEFVNGERRLFPGAAPGIFEYRHKDRKLAFRYTRDIGNRDGSIDALKDGDCLEGEMSDDGRLKLVFAILPDGAIAVKKALEDAKAKATSADASQKKIAEERLAREKAQELHPKTKWMSPMSLLKPPKIARVPRVKPTPVSGWKRSGKVVGKGVVAPLIVKQMALYAKTRFKGEVSAPASTRRIEWTQNHLKSLRRAKNDKTKTPAAQRRALKRAQQKGHDLVASVMGVSSRSLQRRETDYNKGLLREPAVRGARELCKTSFEHGYHEFVVWAEHIESVAVLDGKGLTWQDFAETGSSVTSSTSWMPKRLKATKPKQMLQRSLWNMKHWLRNSKRRS